MKEILASFLENSERALIIWNHEKFCLEYCNKKAKELYDIQDDIKNLDRIFANMTETIREIFVTELQDKESFCTYNIMTIVSDGSLQLADLQVGYIDREAQKVFFEITPKIDTRMERAMQQVDASSRAEGILNFDEKLSLIHCNKHFRNIFQFTEETRHSYYENKFSNGFQEDTRKELLAEIHENLAITQNYTTKMKIVTTAGQELWYSLDLQRRILDNSGQDKVMAYLVNIDVEVAIEEQLNTLNSYFTIMQGMWDGRLHRFDIKNRILYRSAEYSTGLNLPSVGQNYPDVEYLKNLLHPDDLYEYINFIEYVIEENEAESEFRVKNATGEYEHNKLTFKAVRNPDNSIKEMLGFSQSIDHLRKTEAKLDTISKQFNALQELSDDLLFHIEVENKIFTSQSGRLNLFGLTEDKVAFPDALYAGNSIHEDDLDLFKNFVKKVFACEAGSIEIRMKEHETEPYGFRRLIWTCVKTDGKTSTTEIIGKIINVQNVKELEELANYDSLTNALNKRSMLEFTSQILYKSIANDKHALFFLDLDDFKYVNDNLGHAFGDYLLKELGKRLNDSVRSNDLVGRVGGDEFVLFLRDIPNIEILMGKAKMILSTISEDFIDNGKYHNIHASLGIAIYPEHGTSYEELYHHADLALYSSKHKGKNQITVYDNSMKPKE